MANQSRASGTAIGLAVGVAAPDPRGALRLVGSTALACIMITVEAVSRLRDIPEAGTPAAYRGNTGRRRST
jgi:hypothetical protein